MCILFAYINNDAKDGEYQLVIANNRDEFYDRPTAPAARWQHKPACISGTFYFAVSLICIFCPSLNQPPNVISIIN